MQPLRLRQGVGSSHMTAERDVKAVKQALTALDLLKPSSSSTTGIPNRELFDGVRRFQRDNGLRADAVLKPNGPTARLMNAALKERASGAARKTPPSQLTDAVGRGAPNRPADTATVRRTLVETGHLSEAAGAPQGEPDADLDLAIRGLQRDFNLKQDGRIEPGGETERLALRLQSAETVPPREPLKAQIDDQRRALADTRSELEPARQDFAAHQKALAEAEAELADLEASAPDAEPLDPEDFERPDRSGRLTPSDLERTLKSAKKFGRGAAIEVVSLMAQIEFAKNRVKGLRSNEIAKTHVESLERLIRQGEARLEALLRKQRAMTGGDSPP